MTNLIAKAIETELNVENVIIVESIKADNTNTLSLVKYEINFYGNVEKHNSIIETNSKNEVVSTNTILFQNDIKPLEELENSEIVELFNCIKDRKDLNEYKD